MTDRKSNDQPTKRLRKLYPSLAVLLGLAIGVSPGFAGDFITMENEEIQDIPARDPGGHWTPAELMSAQDLEVPIPDISLQDIEEGDGAASGSGLEGVATNAEEAEESEEVDGQNIAEADEVQPDLSDRLFPEMALEVMNQSGRSIFAQSSSDTGAVAPEAVGTNKEAYFSSSRLVPTSARVHYPYRTVGKLFFKKPGGGNFICSAAVLKPRLILTAGHCVHKGSGGKSGYYQKFLFVPAYHKGDAPFQAWNWRYVITTKEWATSNGKVPNKADFALIELEERKFGSKAKKIGNVTGWLGYRTNALRPNHTKKIGYPGNHDRGQIMHQVDSQHYKKAQKSTVLYGSDMRGGSSGGPWVENFGRKAVGQTGALKAWSNRIVGVTSYGYVAVGPKVQGSSILNKSFKSILKAACNHRAGNC